MSVCVPLQTCVILKSAHWARQNIMVYSTVQIHASHEFTSVEMTRLADWLTNTLGNNPLLINVHKSNVDISSGLIHISAEVNPHIMKPQYEQYQKDILREWELRALTTIGAAELFAIFNGDQTCESATPIA